MITNTIIMLISVSPLFFYAESCNEIVCGSVVSKCLLLRACKCDLKTRPCSKDCFNCLGYLYSECCNCVDMCPQIAVSDSDISSQSIVEDLTDFSPQLFGTLTEQPDELDRWTTIVYPVPLQVNLPVKEVGLNNTNITDASSALNCTVLFWSDCMSFNKCKRSCSSVGASSYRWFQDGCCECVGEYCINYGMNKSSCKSCSLFTETEGVSDDDLDYGEDDDIDYEDFD